MTKDTPKPLLPVLGRPFVFFLLDKLWLAGFRTVVLCSGHMGDQIQDAAMRVPMPMRIVNSRETKPLGTAGALRLALPLLPGRTSLVMNGDSYCSFEPAQFLKWHLTQRARCSMLLTHVEDTGRYGRVAVDETGHVVEFEEKGQNQGPGWINAGVYLVEESLIREIPADRECSLEREIFPRLIGCGLFGFCGGGRFLDIGTPEAYQRAAEFFEDEA
jgi:NDP-sugar pyrophosphorylase family protein